MLASDTNQRDSSFGSVRAWYTSAGEAWMPTLCRLQRSGSSVRPRGSSVTGGIVASARCSRTGVAGRGRGAPHVSVKWLVPVKTMCGSRQFLSDRRASGSARFLTLLFALHEGDTWSPAHGAVRRAWGAITPAALDSG